MRWRRYLAVSMLLAASQGAPGVAATLADSAADWSVTGTQGEKNWYNGFFNLTADDDQVYSATDFVPFTNEGAGETSPDGNHWNGNYWDMTSAASGPWTELQQTNSHPNGTNSAPGEEHWTIRRWVSTYDGEGSLITSIADANPNCGNGTTIELYQNGKRLSVVQSASATPTVTTIGAMLKKGDLIDLAMTPEGVDGARGDGCDATFFSLAVTDQKAPPPPPSPLKPIADSFLDFSAEGVQGAKGWYNGYFNLSADDNSTYEAADFIPFTNDGSGPPTAPDGNHWNGQQWDLTGEASGPWTELGAQNTHPNGTNSAPNEEQWTIRRWKAEGINGPTSLDVTWQMAKTNPAGNGVGGILFLNGAMVDEQVIQGNDVAGVDRTLAMTLKPGDLLDLVLTPNGSDGADGSRNRLIIRPRASTPGDFDNDGQLSAADIDNLTLAVLSGTNEARFDLNADTKVNNADREVWVNTLKKTYFGDANLDGQFKTDDFVQIFQAGQYEDGVADNSTWATGDWNGDREFTSSDFVTAFAAGGYEAGPRAAVASVPEPSSLVLLSVGMLMLARRRR